MRAWGHGDLLPPNTWCTMHIEGAAEFSHLVLRDETVPAHTNAQYGVFSVVRSRSVTSDQ